MMDDSNIVIDSKVIAESIKNIRLTHNLSQEEFAKVLNVSPKLVSKWENGARIPRIETFKLINKKYGISFEEITTGLFKPELTEEKAIEYLFKQRITKIIIIISIIIIMFLSALINNKESGYTFVVNTKDFIINKAHLMILSDDYYFDFEEIDKADYIKGNTLFNIYLIQKKKKLIYSCELIDNNCLDVYKNKRINSKTLKSNLDKIYLEIQNNNKNTISKIRFLKYDNNQQIRNIIKLPNEIKYQNEKENKKTNCLSIDKDKLFESIKIYNKMLIINNNTYILRKNKSDYIIFNRKFYYVLPKEYPDIYLGQEGNIIEYWKINSNKICFKNKNPNYYFLSKLINYYN